MLLCYTDAEDVDDDYYDGDIKPRLECVSITPDRRSLPHSSARPSASDSFILQSTPRIGQISSRNSPAVCISCVLKLCLMFNSSSICRQPRYC